VSLESCRVFFGANPITAALATVGTVCMIYAQPSARATFETASVRVNESGNRGGGLAPSPGSLTVRNMPMIACLAWAFNLKSYQIAGPDWLKAGGGSMRYDITAKSAGPVSINEMRPMLASLLEERFQLTTHRETRAIPAYALVVAKGGPKGLKQAADGSQCEENIAPPAENHPRRTTFSFCTIADLALFLPVRGLDRPVLDATGLKGAFHFVFEDPPPDPDAKTPEDQAFSSVFPAVREQLGLNAENRNVPIEMLVIDRILKTPKEN